MNKAENMESIRTWIKKHRPDVLEYYERLEREEATSPGTGMAAGILGFMAMAWEAGRVYQDAHPGLALGPVTEAKLEEYKARLKHIEQNITVIKTSQDKD